MPAPELFQELLARARAVTYVVRMDGPEGTFVYMSPQSTEVLGLAPEQLLAESLEDRLRRIHPDDLEAVIANTKETARTGSFDGRFRYLHPDGRVLHLLNVSRRVSETPGAPAMRMGLIIDVTAEMETSQALHDSEARYRALVERVPAVVYVDSNDPEPNTIYVSPEILKLLGYAPHEWTQDVSLWPRSIHPIDRGRVTEAWGASVRSGLDFRFEYRCIHRDGHIVWVRDATTLIRDDDGNPLFWQGVIQDISDQKLADQALRDSEARFRSLVEQVPAVVYEMGPDDERRTLYVSPHVEEILGYSRQEWLDQPDIWIELLHHDDRERELDAHDRHNRTGEPWVRTYRLIAADGRTVWVRDQAVLRREPDQPDGPGTWHGVMLDITAQKATEEDLHLTNELLEYRVRERTIELEEANELMSMEIAERRRADSERRNAEERYRSLVEQIPAVVYLSTVLPAGPVLADYCSPQVETMLGYTPEEWKVQTLWVARIHPHDRDRILNAWEASKASGEPFSEEFRFLAKDGRIVWVLDETSLLSRDATGRPERFQGVMMDITARKEAEERYRTLVEQLPAIPWTEEVNTITGRSRMIYLGPQTEAVLGWRADELEGDHWNHGLLLHPEDRDAVMRASRAADAEGQTSWDQTYRIIARDGSVRTVRSVGRCVSEPGALTQVWNGITIDVGLQPEPQGSSTDGADAGFSPSA